MNGSFPLFINAKMSQTNWTNILYGLFQSPFHYGSSHWSDYEEYNFPGEKTGFDGQETGTLPSPRSVSVWKFTNNSTSWSSKGRLNLFTRWLLTDNTTRLHWDVTTGRRSLVLKPLCRRDVTRKGLMQMMIKGLPPKPELVLLATMNGTALHAIQGLDLVQEVHLMTQTPVETRKIGIQIIEKDTLKSWDTS